MFINLIMVLLYIHYIFIDVHIHFFAVAKKSHHVFMPMGYLIFILII